MDAGTFYTTIISPNANVLPEIDSPEARFLLLLTAGQESDWTYRVQKPIAYAHSFWQIEKHGAAIEVITNPATADRFVRVCAALNVPPGLDQVFDAIINDDRLAYAMARLRYWIVPEPLPAIDDEDAGWLYYLRTWRPGKPDPARWSRVHALSLNFFQSISAGGPGATA